MKKANVETDFEKVSLFEMIILGGYNGDEEAIKCRIISTGNEQIYHCRRKI